MLSKSFTASLFLLALTSSVTADCVITPALGVSGDPAASNVQHPSTNAPCGSIPISQNIDSSNAIQADGNGQFTPSVTNFATGANGSRLINTVKVDATATGNSFVDCQIVTNGDQDPTSQGTQQLAVKLPDGIKCAGGSDKNRCLVSFVTAAGDGNCVVVTQATTTGKNTTSTDAGKVQTNAKNGDQTNAQNGGQTNANQNNAADKITHKKRMTRKMRM